MLFSSATVADQTDKRLDKLFATLQISDNSLVLRETEGAIWEIWFESDQRDVDALMELGGDAMNSGDLRAAEEIFTRVIDMAPQFSEGWNRRATVRYYQLDYTRSLDDIQRTLALEPRHFGAIWGLGMILGSERDFAAAIEAFEQLLRIKPRSKEAKYRIELLKKEIAKNAV